MYCKLYNTQEFLYDEIKNCLKYNFQTNFFFYSLDFFTVYIQEV